MTSISKLQNQETLEFTLINSSELVQSTQKHNGTEKTEKVAKELLELPLQRLSLAQLTEIALTASILGNQQEPDLLNLSKELGIEIFAQIIHDVIRNFPCTKESNQQLTQFLDSLIQDFPELGNYIYTDTKEAFRVIQSEGMRLLVKNAKNEKVRKCIVCCSSSEFQEQLESTLHFPQTFILHDPIMRHYLALYVTKNGDSFDIFSSDSAFDTDAVLQNFRPLLSSNIKHVFYAPYTTIFEGLRQTQRIGCDFFALDDIKCWMSDPKLAERIKQRSIVTDKIGFVSWEEFYSLGMIRSAQSFTLIRQFKKAQVELIALNILGKEERNKAIENLKIDFNNLNKRLNKHTVVIDDQHQNWYIEKRARKGLAQLIKLVLTEKKE